MIIDTGYDIGQVVWGVARDRYDENVPCEACGGTGERTVPGTDIAIECRPCGGVGDVAREVHRYYVVEAAIADIDVRVGRYRMVPELTFSFGYERLPSTKNFVAVAGDREAAVIEARRHAEKDEYGRLHPDIAAREEAAP